jgi:hypothetical protein
MFEDLPRLRDARRRRASSYDRTGGNRDYITVPPGETVTLADLKGPGRITHIWMTLAGEEEGFLRKVLLRMSWDEESSPSVDVPVGDFFGCGHGLTRNFDSILLSMSPQDGRGFNCFFPMPYRTSARIEVRNGGEKEVPHLFYYIDYEEGDQPEDAAYFHALWRRENPTDGISDEGMTNWEYQMEGENPTGEGNYEILRARGRGHYVGCVLSIYNLRQTEEDNWYGEGDDMIFIDGDEKPTLHGTGTEDYFNTAWGPREAFSGLHHGIVLPGGKNWSGPISLYRFHVADPIHFRKSIRVTIEHGHANRRSDDYSSVAYWYQTEPHQMGTDSNS